MASLGGGERRKLGTPGRLTFNRQFQTDQETSRLERVKKMTFGR
jgi:hypothetical protein